MRKLASAILTINHSNVGDPNAPVTSKAVNAAGGAIPELQTSLQLVF